MRRVHGHLPNRLHQLYREWTRGGIASPTSSTSRESRPGPLRLGHAKDWPRYGEGRGPLLALRIVCGALPDWRLGYAKVPGRYCARIRQGIMSIVRLNKINDFVVKFANVNGSGSPSAHRPFARSILRMGVPIASRNIFPSNIQGLPTWYEVRVTEAGHRGRRGGGVDLMVAMNPQSWDHDVREIERGGYIFYDSTRPLPAAKFRGDIHIVGMPLTAMSNERYSDPRQRQLFKNIIYVGALAFLLDIDIGELERL